jgi:hypothetical protein
MTFRNPWIDPRVTQVRSAAAQAYLVQRGWKPGPPAQQNLLPFERPADGDPGPMVLVPTLEQGRDYPQRIVELITDLALAEGRYAVDVLNDILRQTPAEADHANGTQSPTQAEPATR